MSEFERLKAQKDKILHCQRTQLEQAYIDIQDGYIELNNKLLEAQGQLELEKEKVKILLSVVTFEDRDICPEPYEFTTCPEGDGWKQGNCLACWANYLDLEAAKRLEEKL